MHARTFLAGIATMLIGCAPPPWEDTGSSAPKQAPAIEILFPKTSVTTEYCARFTVVVDVTDYPLASDDDEGGHWLLWEGPDCELELLGRSSDAFLSLAAPLVPGTHILYAELVDRDDQPLDPAVRYRTSIRVAESNEACVGGDAGWGGTDTGGR